MDVFTLTVKCKIYWVNVVVGNYGLELGLTFETTTV